MFCNYRKFKIKRLLILLLLSIFMMFNYSSIINGEDGNQTTIIDGDSFNEKDTLFATDNNGNKYYSMSDAWNAAIKGKAITMQCDWYLGDNSLKVNKYKTVTIYMNGHKIDCGFKRRAIYVYEKARLYLYGGQDTKFTYSYYDIGDVLKTDGYLVSGGLITGGLSKKSGGGIALDEGASLYAKNIGICGNRTSGGNLGGGGLGMNESDCYAELENVVISHNYGYRHAGGVDMGGDRNTLILKNTTISYNHTYFECGGINISGIDTTVEMLEGTTISHNYAKKYAGGILITSGNSVVRSSDKSAIVEYNTTAGHGGGIAVDYYFSQYGNLGALIDGIAVRNNYATSGDISDVSKINYTDNGGGVYVDTDKATIINCTIENNGASLGGGVYINGGSGNDATLIKDTTIKNNYTPGKGGGIFVSCTDDVRLSGDVYIENNKSGSEDDDVFLNTGFFDTKAYIYDDISSSSRVGIKLDTVNDYRDLVKNVSNYIEGTYFLDAYTDECYLNYSNNTLSSKRGSTTYSVTVDKEELGRYKVGSTVTLTSSKDFFYGYKTSDLKDKILRPTSSSKSISFIMPTSPVSLKSIYYQSISEATLKVDAPIAGKALPTKAILSWTNEDGNQEKEVDVSWLEYLNGSYKEVTSNIAAYGTDYSVKANILQDKDKNLFFGSNLDIYGNFKVAYKDGDNSYTYTAKADGGGTYVDLIGSSYTTKLGEVYVNDVLIGSYKKGSIVVIDGTDSSKRFASWNSSTQVTIEDINKAVTSFTMTNDKEVRLYANYTSPITNVTLTVGLPKVGSSLSNLHNGTFSYEVDGKPYSISSNDIYISWRVKNNGSDEYVDMDSSVSYNTEYMAYTAINPDISKQWI